MRRFAILALVLATGAVAYAAVGDHFAAGSMFGWFTTSRRLPALRTTDLPFRYPARLYRQGVEGEVLLRIHITEAGDVDSVVMVRSSGSAELDSVALKGAEHLKYHPATQGERAVAVWAQLPVRFQRSFDEPVKDDG